MEIFEFKKEIDEMSEGQLRATAREFREKHNEQVEEANETEDELTEYKEMYEDAKEAANEAEQYFAEKAAEVKDMDAELLADRFDVGELREMVEDAEEAGEFDETPDENDGGTKFEDRPPKAPVKEETVTYNEERALKTLSDAALIPEN